MCGILVSVQLAAQNTDSWPDIHVWDDLCKANGARGPDSQAEHVVDVDIDGQKIILRFFSSVLYLRGDHVAKQPFVSEDGDVFCWNGEVFEGLEIREQENDGELLFQSLPASTADPANVFARIEGPYAFVHFKRSSNRLYFARDPVGRRSLLKRASPGEGVLLASVGVQGAGLQEEVSPEGIHYVDLRRFATGSSDAISVLPRAVPGAKESLIRPIDINTQLPPEHYDRAAESETFSAAVDAFIQTLEESVRLRVQHIPRTLRSAADDSSVGILFSGGVDCTLLALLAHRCLPLKESIDLLNVAFENPRGLGATTTRKQPRTGEVNRSASKYDVPDRQTGMEAVQELRALSPGRKWNFIAVDVPYEECVREQPKVEELMFPSNTVMDLSLANALYFASRGVGRCIAEGGPSCEYRSPARVLLSGLGADEQLGGYSRHRRAFARDGWHGLIEELQLDITRLPSRNLGRDDRVISSWGKETRYPYLALSFIAFLSRLPAHLKVDPRLPEGTGDKLLLRTAAEKLGLVKASERRKRAMQFGSRSARMGEADRKGHLPVP